MGTEFLSSLKGALYPVDVDCLPGLHAGSCHSSCSCVLPCFGRENSAGSLADVAAQRIVMDSSLTLKTIHSIPDELCITLMRAALGRNRDRAMEVLLAHWPYAVLSVRDLAPDLFQGVSQIYNAENGKDHMRIAVKYTTTLAHTFVECLKKRMPTKLKYLDMSGFPAAEIIVQYLVSHCLLIYNEGKQKEVIQAYNDIVKHTPESERTVYTVDETVPPDDSYRIKLDACVTNGENHMELCKALKVSQFQSVHFGLQITKMDASCIGEARLTILLQYLVPEHLLGLRLKYNALTDEGFVRLAPLISRFNKITALDLSCNNINWQKNYEACNALMAIFRELTSLKRLDMSSNRLKEKVWILGYVAQPLQYLRLSGCCLSETDVHFLGKSHHASGITELDFSENVLGTMSCTSLGNFFDKFSNLMVLELESCGFQTLHLCDLMKVISKLHRLKYVNISQNAFDRFELLESIHMLLPFPQFLQLLRISFPTGINEENCDDVGYEFEKDLIRAMTEVAKQSTKYNLFGVELDLLDRNIVAF